MHTVNVAYTPGDRWYRLVDHEPVEITRHEARVRSLAGNASIVRVELEEWPYGFVIHAIGDWNRIELGRLHDKIEDERCRLLGIRAP